MTTKIRVANMDFDAIKADLINFLKSKPEFTDYNFEGSNLNVILELLSYNTHYQAVMANFLGNEMFLDTAAKRSSVVSHAKYLGYTPQSVSAPKAVVNLSITIPTPETQQAMTVPRGTRFTTIIEGTTYTFTTIQNYVTNSRDSESGGFDTYLFDNVEIYEGFLAKNTVTYSQLANKIEIPNPNIDLATLQVRDSQYAYARSVDFISIDDTSRAFFVQEGLNEKYEIYFGDGVIGRKPADGESISLEYLVSSGAGANGAKIFTPASSFGTSSNVVVTTVSKANGGKNPETIDSIRYNAVNYFGAQNRAVTAEDYKLMASLASQNIRSITSWGGENHEPPDFGAIYLCIVPTAGETLTLAEREVITNFVKKKAVGNTRIRFADPDYIDLILNTSVTFDRQKIDITPYDLSLLVRSTIVTYNRENLSKFLGKFRLSNLSKEIDNTHDSILSNTSNISLVKYLSPNLYETEDITINVFNQINSTDTLPTVTSDTFIRAGDNTSVFLEDDRKGNMRISSFVNGAKRVLDPFAGEVDYKKGIIYIKPIAISSYSNDYLTFMIKPTYTDISSNRNVVLRLSDKNVTVSTKVDE